MASIIILSIIAIIFLSWIIGIYNNLIAKKNQVENTFSSIDVYLKNRFDLIPNLVAVAKQAVKSETKFIEKAISLRNQVSNPDLSMDDKIHLDNQASQLFTRIFALSECDLWTPPYPGPSVIRRMSGLLSFSIPVQFVKYH